MSSWILLWNSSSPQQAHFVYLRHIYTLKIRNYNNNKVGGEWGSTYKCLPSNRETLRKERNVSRYSRCYCWEEKKTAFSIVIVLEAGLSVCVSGEFESGAKRSAPRLPTRRTHTQKINRNLNATPAIFHPYQNVPTDRRERSVPFVWLSIAPVIFIYFYEKLK